MADERTDYARGVKGEIDQRPKRFYTDVSIAAENGLWRILLDNRALRTAAGRPLVIPSERLAEVIAAEWRGQVERIDLYTMHITRMAYGALDRTPEVWEAIAAEAARFAGTDLVCYLADGPAILLDRQQAAWAPLREWAATAHGVALEAVVGIIPKAQPEASLEAVRAHVVSLDVFRRAGIAHAIPLFGSAVLGLAVERGRLSAVEAYELSRIDEAFQVERWGEDAEAVNSHRARPRRGRRARYVVRRAHLGRAAHQRDTLIERVRISVDRLRRQPDIRVRVFPALILDGFTNAGQGLGAIAREPPGRVDHVLVPAAPTRQARLRRHRLLGLACQRHQLGLCLARQRRRPWPPVSCRKQQRSAFSRTTAFSSGAKLKNGTTFNGVGGPLVSFGSSDSL